MLILFLYISYQEYRNANEFGKEFIIVMEREIARVKFIQI